MSQSSLIERADRALAAELAARGAGESVLAIVLGSGLGPIAERLEERTVIPAQEFEHLPRARVQGHAGSIALGTLGGVRVIMQSGRVHLYEGRSPFEVTRMVRACARLGVRGLALTNASGSLHAEWEPGTFVRVTDHLNLQGKAALHRGEGQRTTPYDEHLGRALDAAAAELGIALRRGVYAAMPGPSYETPAEIRALRALGADAVGMSTVAEASAAHAAGMRVVAVSCIANPAAGIGAEPLRHEDVLAVMRSSAVRLGALLERALPAWDRELPRAAS